MFQYCICINCSFLTTCNIYKEIENNHKEINISKNSFFHPYFTNIIINIGVVKAELKFEWDVKECSSFLEEPGAWYKN